MLIGIEFYRRVVELQEKLTPPGRRCFNALQTNGVLLDDEWCAFFKKHGFLIGLSIDGPADLHNRHRVDKHGEPTFDRVNRGLGLLRDHSVNFNTLVVVNRHNGDHPRRVYRFLTEHGVEFLQFIPIVERMPGVEHGGRPEAVGNGPNRWDPLVSQWSVRPEQFGRFLTEVFEEWVRHRRRPGVRTDLRPSPLRLDGHGAEPLHLPAAVRPSPGARTQRRPVQLRPLRRAGVSPWQHPRDADCRAGHSPRASAFRRRQGDDAPALLP